MAGVRRWPLIALAGALALVAVVAVAVTVVRCSGSAAPPVGSSATPRSGLPTVSVADLPTQARDVLALVDRGGPFKHKQDGTTFGNRERRLPARPRDYYREYTVPTPGSRDRGARRLIAGRGGDVYYTDDHYATFRQVIR